jgi:type IV secretion system protein VirB5
MSDLQTLMTKTNDRVSNIEKLRQEINQTKDLKAASDLTSRMEAESADIQNQQQQMQIVFQQTQLQQLVIDEQEREDNARYFAPKTGLKLQPIQW